MRTRRTILAAFAGGGLTVTAGCLGNSTDNSDDSNPENEPDDEDENTTSFVIDIESIEVDGTAEFSAELSSEITPDHHGQLSVRLINELDEPVVVSKFVGNANTVVPFHVVRFDAIDGAESILLNATDFPEQVGDCWVADYGTDDAVFFPEIGPGEAVEGDVGVFTRTTGDESEGPCGVSGTYEGTEEYELFKPENGHPTGEPIEKISVTMRLSLTDME